MNLADWIALLVSMLCRHERWPTTGDFVGSEEKGNRWKKVMDFHSSKSSFMGRFLYFAQTGTTRWKRQSCELASEVLLFK